MSAPLSERRLAEILARANAATSGPWCTDSWEIYQGEQYLPGLSFWIGETCRGTADLEQDRADASFVAAARTDVPELVAEVIRLRAERHSTNEALSDAAEQLRVQRDRIAELEVERKKYVGVEPTVAEEMAYMNRCLNAVYAVCDAAERQATRWEQPLAVPEWVAVVRNAADGLTLAAPALLPAKPRPSEGELAEQRHLLDPLDHALEALAPRTTPTAGSAL